MQIVGHQGIWPASSTASLGSSSGVKPEFRLPSAHLVRQSPATLLFSLSARVDGWRPSDPRADETLVVSHGSFGTRGMELTAKAFVAHSSFATLPGDGRPSSVLSMETVTLAACCSCAMGAFVPMGTNSLVDLLVGTLTRWVGLWATSTERPSFGLNPALAAPFSDVAMVVR